MWSHPIEDDIMGSQFGNRLDDALRFPPFDDVASGTKDAEGSPLRMLLELFVAFAVLCLIAATEKGSVARWIARSPLFALAGPSQPCRDHEFVAPSYTAEY